MKINVDDIPAAGLSVDIKEDGLSLEAVAGPLGYSVTRPVAAHLDLTASDGNVYVAGEVKAGLGLNCSRCLKDFEYDMDTSFSVFFVRGKEDEKEKELKPAELDVNYLDGPELDTTELLLGQITLDVPMQPLCSEGCRGLCPKCGADLNLGDCGCVGKEKIDSRFSLLKDFKVK